ncbi:MAG TPA: cupin domain-containing protein [Puia sp.]|jgi:quercetin dioxygenase-like cupin family protein
MKKNFLAAAITIVVLAAFVIPGSGLAQQPGIKRTELQRHDLSIPGHETIQVRVDFDPGAMTPRLSHPGEEVIYVLQGWLEYQVGHDPPLRLRTGDVLFIPAGTVHTAKNVGEGKAAELTTYVVKKGKRLIVIVR